jgi:protein phosphatase 1D
MRVTANSNQGGRKYMEDCYKIRFQRESSLNKNKSIQQAINESGFLTERNNSDCDILCSYFGVFDGHGGAEAAQYAKTHLYSHIVEQSEFWSANDDECVLNAIKKGFVKCHLNMWDECSKWPKTQQYASTSGCTATVLFIRNSKAYIGHIGDSSLIIGYKNSNINSSWLANKLTKDHKPDDLNELNRIYESGGTVKMSKTGLNRVVWNRSNLETGYTESIPFLAVSRSLGDFWSYNPNQDEFIISPEPDVFCIDLDTRYHKCLILSTDGLTNSLDSNECVRLVQSADRMQTNQFINPSQQLIAHALDRYNDRKIKGDNLTCITIMLDDNNNNDELNPDDIVIHSANLTNILSFSSSNNNNNILINKNKMHSQMNSTTYSFVDTLTNNQSSSSVSIRRRRWSGGSNSQLHSKLIINPLSDIINQTDSCYISDLSNSFKPPTITINNEHCLSGSSKFSKFTKNIHRSLNDLTTQSVKQKNSIKTNFKKLKSQIIKHFTRK